MGEIAIRNKSFIQSMHNDIQCLSLDDVTRPCDRCWFTSKQIQDWAGMNKDTLNRKLEKLARVGRIVGLKEDETVDNIIDINITNDGNTDENSSGSNLSLMNFATNSDIRCIKLPDERGTLHYNKIYNLNVLNHLAMVELDNDKLNSIANKFSDILSEVETTGSYNIQKSTPSYEIEDPIKRAKAWIREQEAKLALEAKNNELTEQLAITSNERDKAIKSRGRINNRITASSMQLAGQCVKEIKYLESECAHKDEEIHKQANQIIDTLDKLDTANHQRALVESKLDAILSNMYSVDDAYHHVENLFHTGYQPNTLRSKLRKELNRISYIFGEVPRAGVNRGNPEHNPPKYYTKRVVEQIIENGKNDPMYFKRLKG